MIGFSSPGKVKRSHVHHQSGIRLHLMVAVRMASSGAPVFAFLAGRLTCAQPPEGASRNTLLGIAQVIMLGELAVSRALDRIHLPG